MKRAPVLVATSAAIFFAIEPFIGSPRLLGVSQVLTDVVIGLTALAALIAVAEVLRREIARLTDRERRDGLASAALLGGFVVTTGVGLGAGTGGEALAWLFRWVFEPLQSTMLALVGFALVSAALRSFRVRSFEVALLLLAAAIVLLGRAPLSPEVDAVLGPTKVWLTDVPNLAAQRALLIGAAIAALTTMARLVLGIERDYLGGRRE